MWLFFLRQRLVILEMRVTSHDWRGNRRIYASRFRQTSFSRMEMYFWELLLEVVSLDSYSRMGQFKFLFSQRFKTGWEVFTKKPKIRCTLADT